MSILLAEITRKQNYGNMCSSSLTSILTPSCCHIQLKWHAGYYECVTHQTYAAYFALQTVASSSGIVLTVSKRKILNLSRHLLKCKQRYIKSN